MDGKERMMGEMKRDVVLVHSPSAVKMYEDCPYKYMRIRVRKDVEDEIGPAGQRGVHVHQLLRTIVEGEERRMEVEIDGPPGDAVDKEFYAIMKMVKRGSDIADEMKRKGFQVQAEVQVGLDRNLEAVGFSSSQVWMRGVIDMLALGKHEARVIDWKTGKPRYDRFQPDVYAMAVFARHPDVQTIKFMYAWLKTGKRSEWDYTRDEMPKLGRRLNKATKPIEQDETWEKTDGYQCRWCPVLDCQHNKNRRAFEVNDPPPESGSTVPKGMKGTLIAISVFVGVVGLLVHPLLAFGFAIIFAVFAVGIPGPQRRMDSSRVMSSAEEDERAIAWRRANEEPGRREREEAERKAREEAERREREEAERREREELARAPARKRAAEEYERAMAWKPPRGIWWR